MTSEEFEKIRSAVYGRRQISFKAMRALVDEVERLRMDAESRITYTNGVTVEESPFQTLTIPANGGAVRIFVNGEGKWEWEAAPAP